MAKTILHHSEDNKIKAIAARENVGAKHIKEYINELLGDFLENYRASFGGKSIQTVCPDLDTEELADDLEISHQSAKEIINMTVDGDGECECGGDFIDGDVECCGHVHEQSLCECCGKHEN